MTVVLLLHKRRDMPRMKSIADQFVTTGARKSDAELSLPVARATHEIPKIFPPNRHPCRFERKFQGNDEREFSLRQRRADCDSPRVRFSGNRGKSVYIRRAFSYSRITDFRAFPLTLNTNETRYMDIFVSLRASRRTRFAYFPYYSASFIDFPAS